jgi:pimeloyl-ACP methyl ester carboxylesterase
VTPSQWRAAKRFAPVLGRQMAYVESGTGRPIVLLHGNPTSSYLWRSVLPALRGVGRCVIPNLIGMGDSDKLGAGDPGRYPFARHREFLDAEPGSILTGAVRDFCRTWPDQAEVTVPGIHFIQEDSGTQIGRAIAAWLQQLPG